MPETAPLSVTFVCATRIADGACQRRRISEEYHHSDPLVPFSLVHSLPLSMLLRPLVHFLPAV